MRRKLHWPLPVVAVIALVAGAGTAGGTLALWNGSLPTASATITSGDLGVTADDPVWREVSADVDTSPREIDPATFLVRQGDELTADFTYHVTLEGDNIRAAIRVLAVEMPSLPAGVTATYEMLDAADAVLSGPQTLGTASAVTEHDFQGTEQFSVRVTLAFDGLADRFGGASAEQLIDLGKLEVEVQQIRTGGGFQ